MTLETVYCAICGNPCGLDSDHVEVDAEHVKMTDRNSVKEFVFHPECWQRLSKGWIEPA